MVSQLLDLPGLQIFLPQGEKSDLDQTLETPIMQGSLKFNSIKRVSTPYYDSLGLNEYSPTVVDGELFDNQAHHPNNNDIIFNDSTSISQQIDRIKNDLRGDKYNQFNDEFRYQIVSSHILNDCTPSIQKLQIKRSILDLRRSTDFKDQWVLDHLMGNNWENVVNIKFSRLILRCCQVFISLKKCQLTGNARQKSFMLLSNAFYLIHKVKQQVYNMSKYKLMLSLKEFLKRLEDCDMLIHKFLLNYKTLRNSHIFEESSSIKEYSSDNETFYLVKNLITSSLDCLFFSLRYNLEKILPLTNKESLSKYTDIYGINPTDLRYFLNSEIKNLNDKADRVNITQKFLLCCLLSISFQIDNSVNSDEFPNAFDNIFSLKFAPSSDPKTTKDILKNCEVITREVTNLANSMQSTVSLLINYKDFLNQTTAQYDISTITSHDYAKTPRYQAIRLLNEVESKLLLVTDAKEKSLIQNRINEILDTTLFNDDNNENERFSYESNNKCHLLNQSTYRNTSTSLHKSNRGFSLDILKHNQDLSSSSHKGPHVINLNEKVEFTKIDNTMVLSDTEDVYEERYIDRHKHTIYSDYEDDVGTPFSLKSQLGSAKRYANMTTTNFDQTPEHVGKSQHYETLHKLSDEELSLKLNEKIINFGSKNKMGKNQLRAQKSFELLKRQDKVSHPHQAYHSSRLHNTKQHIRNITGPLSTEDTIPIIYEMREFMDN
ncbi:inheritance of peroxisomes protein 2 [Monosporozyma servazzii]